MWVRWCHPERKQLPISPLAGGWKGKDPWELLLLVSAGQAGRARLCKERSEGTRCPGSSRTHPASLEGAETTSLGPPHGLFLLKGREKACSVKSTGPLIATARARVCVCVCVCVCVLVTQWCPTLRSYGMRPAGLLCPRDSPGKNTGLGCLFFLKGIFLIWGSKFSSPALARILHR